MLKTITVVGLILISICTHASDIDVAAGKFVLKEMNKNKESVILTLHELHDSDKSYAPSVAFNFYRDDSAITYSIGIIKTDGKQGISTFMAVGSPGNTTKQTAVETNLSLNTPYKFSYEYIGDTELELVLAGKPLSLKVDFLPVKVELVVSGMNLSINNAP